MASRLVRQWDWLLTEQIKQLQERNEQLETDKAYLLRTVEELRTSQRTSADVA
jgi:CTP:phosphocholine cytidylyltransferase-like protein